MQKKSSSTKVLPVILFSPQTTKLGRIKRGLASEYIRRLIDEGEEVIKQHRQPEEGNSCLDANATRRVERQFKIYPQQQEKLARVRKTGISIYIRELIDRDEEIIKDFLAEG